MSLESLHSKVLGNKYVASLLTIVKRPDPIQLTVIFALIVLVIVGIYYSIVKRFRSKQKPKKKGAVSSLICHSYWKDACRFEMLFLSLLLFVVAISVRMHNYISLSYSFYSLPQIQCWFFSNQAKSKKGGAKDQQKGQTTTVTQPTPKSSATPEKKKTLSHTLAEPESSVSEIGSDELEKLKPQKKKQAAKATPERARAVVSIATTTQPVYEQGGEKWELVRRKR